jgi:fructokinase
LFGAIEAGGTKFICGVGTGPGDLTTVQIPSTTPEETVGGCIEMLSRHNLKAVGIASFGPLNLRTGHITSTPKAGWKDFDIAGTIGRALGVVVGFDTDVNGAALGEARWGAAQDLSDFLYLTIGTGIGGGAISNGRVVHGMLHPEMGHIRIPHDTARDPFHGCCPYHGDCLEGLASGPAIEARWGVAGRELPPGHPAWELEARYLALGIATWVCTLSPQRIVMGGGVMQQPHLFPLIRKELACILNGYIRATEILEGLDSYVVPPVLGSRSGVLGALVLGELALTQR